ncbi:MAG: hypothetical protein ABJN34_12190 [Litoreibacter sp.]|uniref:hypothetical protein n=1 Tax=Litoreibacter sp. TaxID=1969459 RepID=UPI003297703D
MLRLALPIAIGLASASASFAQVDIRFTEGTPTDTFTLTNTGCALSAVTVVIDGTGSYGGMIFDTKDGGAVSDAAQPFQILNGQISAVAVEDAGPLLRFQVLDWPSESVVSFTIDVDDVLRHGDQGRTQVSGGEIAGAEVRISSDTASGFGVFDNTRRATVRRLCGS